MELIKTIELLENSIEVPLYIKLVNSQDIKDIVDYLRELAAYRNEGKYKNPIGKAVVNRLIPESSFSDPVCVISNFQRVIEDYNKLAIEKKDEGYPEIELTVEPNKDNEFQAMKIKLEIKFPLQDEKINLKQ